MNTSTKLDLKNFEDFNFASRALQYIARAYACVQYSAHAAIMSSWNDDQF